MTYDIKQYILTNTKNNWTHGKRAVQIAHASMKVFFDSMTQLGEFTWDCRFTNDEIKWIKSNFAKITLKVPGVDLLFEGMNIAGELNIPAAFVQDNGTTQDAGNEGATVAIGPYNVTDIKYLKMNKWFSQWKLY